jgi:hypothetical protein
MMSTADVSDLQQGMQQATSAVEATTSALRSGAAQINATFASLSQSYASDAARKITTAQTSSDTELAIARQNEQTRYDIALNGVKGAEFARQGTGPDGANLAPTRAFHSSRA